MICHITVWSPVKTYVYLNNKDCLLMIIDPDSGFDYSHNTCGLNKRFTLYFKAKGFSKMARFQTPLDGRFEWSLKDILTPEEILASYDRADALKRIESRPSGYAFTELGAVGMPDDIPLIERFIDSSRNDTFWHDQYVTAQACTSMANIANRSKDPGLIASVHSFLRKTYESYTAKDSYGWMIERSINSLALRGI